VFEVTDSSEEAFSINDPIGRAALQGYHDAVAGRQSLAEYYSDQLVELPGWPSPVEGFSTPREAYSTAYVAVIAENLNKQFQK
jgi:dTDP-4-amino-4,6-dideoxygalactose transaminase